MGGIKFLKTSIDGHPLGTASLDEFYWIADGNLQTTIQVGHVHLDKAITVYNIIQGDSLDHTITPKPFQRTRFFSA